MSEGLMPWEIHKALTPERLATIGRILWDVRRDVALRMERKKGDTLFGAGCSAWERSKFALATASKGEYREWLSVLPGDRHFTVSISGVPVRFYRGDLEAPAPSRYTQKSKHEIDALELAFSLFDTPTPEYGFRFEIETNADGMPLRIVLLQLDEHGERHNQYEVPIKVETKTERLSRRQKPVKLPLPPIRSRKPKNNDDQEQRKTGDAS